VAVIGPPSSVGAVVVTYNSEADIAECLAALGPALEGVETSQIIVVDNASTDATCEVAERCAPEARLLRLTQNRGYASGLNAGAAVAGDLDALLVLNPDVRLSPGAVVPLLHALALPGTAVAVPKVLNATGALEPTLRRESTVLRALGEATLGGNIAGRSSRLGEMVTRPERYEAPTTVDWASGSVMLVSRRCYDALGGWDESFFHGSEETDFCLRAGDRGWSVRYAPGAIATHSSGSSERSPYLRPIMFANRLELYRRRRGRLRAVAFRVALALNEGLRSYRGAHHRATLATLLTGRRPAPPNGP